MKRVLILMMIWQAASAQKVQVLVPKEPVIIGNAFQVQFIVPGTAVIDNIAPPVTDSIKLISGPNVYKGTTIINGREEAVQNVAFTLVASALGHLRIRETTVNFRNGDEIITEAATILVVPQIKASFNSRSNFTDLNLYMPTSKEDLDELITENLFIKTEVDKKTCYVGEPVVATFKLYSRLQSSSEVVNAPSLYGFSVMDILNTNEAHQAIETIGNKVFNTSILRKLQLYPERSGRLIIDPMELDNEIEFNDSVDEHHPNVVQRAISSPEVPILVKALPVKKPKDYSGAVGKFRISARVTGTTITTNQQGELVVTVSGKGNYIQLGPPQISWPKEFEVFDPEVNDQLNKNLVPVEGRREYTYHFTSGTEGGYTIPPIHFIYFDPSVDSFCSVTTDSIQMNVSRSSKQAVVTMKEFSEKRSGKSWLFVLLLLVPALFYWWIKRDKIKKKKVENIPLVKTVSYTERLAALDVSSMPGKETCLLIQKILTEAGRAHPFPQNHQKEFNSICEACRLFAYSTAEDEGKTAELKKRAVKLMIEVEGTEEKMTDDR